MSALASATTTLRPAALSLAAKVLPPLPNPMIRASVVIVGEVLGVLMALGVLMDMVTSLRIRVIRVRCADVLCAVRRLFSSLTAEALSTDAGWGKRAGLLAFALAEYLFGDVVDGGVFELFEASAVESGIDVVHHCAH